MHMKHNVTKEPLCCTQAIKSSLIGPFHVLPTVFSSYHTPKIVCLFLREAMLP